MKIIKLHIKITEDKIIRNEEINNLSEFIKDMIYDLDDAYIEDVTYEIHDSYQD
jgi:hypothetical protein